MITNYGKLRFWVFPDVAGPKARGVVWLNLPGSRGTQSVILHRALWLAGVSDTAVCEKNRSVPTRPVPSLVHCDISNPFRRSGLVWLVASGLVRIALSTECCPSSYVTQAVISTSNDRNASMKPQKLRKQQKCVPATWGVRCWMCSLEDSSIHKDR